MKKMVTLKNRAFTLVELLVVILILGVLAALIVPNILGRVEQAKITAARTDISTLGSALKTFQIDNDRYPTTEEGLEALRTAPADAPNWKRPYLERAVPLDPWQNAYEYSQPGPDGDEDSYLLKSYGPDKIADNEDDITNQD